MTHRDNELLETFATLKVDCQENQSLVLGEMRGELEVYLGPGESAQERHKGPADPQTLSHTARSTDPGRQAAIRVGAGGRATCCDLKIIPDDLGV